MNRSLRIAFIAAVLATLAGCGNKGPLMLPQKPVPVDPATVPATPAGEVPAEAVPAETAPATDTEEATEAEIETATPVEPPPSDDDGNGGRSA